MNKSAAFLVTTLLASVAIASGGVAEAGDTLEVAKSVPPEEIAADIREKLEPTVYRIANEEGMIFEFWLVSTLELEAMPEQGRKALDGISGITLLGAAKVHAKERYDFRDDPIDPGVYTIRMGIQPNDGNHIGTAPYDTFAMLVPHKRDATLDGIADHDALVELSMEGTVGQHPSVFSLQPMKLAEGEFPRLTEGGDDWKFLCIKLPIKAGDKTGALALQLVYEGAGDL